MEERKLGKMRRERRLKDFLLDTIIFWGRRYGSISRIGLKAAFDKNSYTISIVLGLFVRLISGSNAVPEHVLYLLGFMDAYKHCDG
jgi:hypothetical protein